MNIEELKVLLADGDDEKLRLVERLITEVTADAYEDAVKFLSTTPACIIAGKGGAAERLLAEADRIRQNGNTGIEDK